MSDTVWIRASVEEMAETDSYLAVPRAEWDAMTSEQQQILIDDFGHETLNDCGGYGVGVIDESEVPEEWKS